MGIVRERQIEKAINEIMGEYGVLTRRKMYAYLGTLAWIGVETGRS